MSVLSWMAMLFYLPRLFVYHAENKTNDGFVSVVKIQEMKLYRFIGTPAMIATLLSGVAMIILNPAMLHEGWLHAKLLFITALIVFHFDCGKHVKLFADNISTKEGKFYRMYNEIPTLLMVGIVIFVIIKPF